jgi:hypothetical protein
MNMRSQVYRRTGVTLPQAQLDENGLEEITGLFSSPVKASPLKQNPGASVNANDVQNSALETSEEMSGMDSMCERPLNKQAGNKHVLLCYATSLSSPTITLNSQTDMLLWQVLGSRLLKPYPHVDLLVHQLYLLLLDQPLHERVELLGAHEEAIAFRSLPHPNLVN